MGPNGAVPKMVGVVQIHLSEDGQVFAQCQVPGRNALLMMLEVAKIDLLQKFAEKSPIEIAPPGVLVRP